MFGNIFPFKKQVILYTWTLYDVYVIYYFSKLYVNNKVISTIKIIQCKKLTNLIYIF